MSGPLKRDLMVYYRIVKMVKVPKKWSKSLSKYLNQIGGACYVISKYHSNRISDMVRVAVFFPKYKKIVFIPINCLEKPLMECQKVTIQEFFRRYV